MLGREEIDIKIRNRNLQMIENLPSWGIDYYYSLDGKTEATKKAYTEKLRSFLDYCKESLNVDIDDLYEFKKVKPMHITRYIKETTDTGSSNRNLYYAIKSLFDFLELNEYIEVNHFLKMKAPKDKSKHEVTVLTNKEIKKVLYNLEHPPGGKKAVESRLYYYPRNKAMFLLAIFTGLRVRSMIEININDINWTERYIKVTQKGDTIHKACFSEEIEIVLKDYLKFRRMELERTGSRTQALFLNRFGERCSRKAFAELLEWSTYNIDKVITPHKLRATCCTGIINKTGNINLAAHVLGHANIANTMRYIDTGKGMDEQAVSTMDKILFED